MIASSAARSPLRRSVALGVSLVLAVPLGVMAPAMTPTAWAGTGPQPAPEPSKAPAADEAALEEARKLYDEGKARFDTFDYEGAVETWTQAYAKLPPTEAAIRNRMVYNIATAQEKAFELDNDIQHLRAAVKLLESYLDNYKALYERSPETEAEVQKAEDRIAVLEERIAEAEKGQARPPPEIEGESDEQVGWTGDTTPSDPELLAKNQRLSREERKTDRILIASYVTLSVGGLFALAGTATILGARAVEEEPDPMMMMEETGPDTTETVRGGGIGGLVLGMAGIVAGATLLGIGLDRRKKAKNGTLVSGGPIMGPGLTGAGVRVRF